MRNKMTYLLVALLVLVLSVSCSSTDKPYAEVELSVSGSVASGEYFDAMAQGSTLKVELDANATTGYQWSCDISDSMLVAKTSDDYIQDSNESHMLGVGGTACYEFKALAPGKLTISFDYSRSWEGAAIRNVKLFVVIDKNLNFAISDYEEN